MNPPLVAIVGPTASGKSALGIFWRSSLAAKSSLAIRHSSIAAFDIGTAETRSDERADIAAPLLDILEPTEESTAGGYRERAIAILDEPRGRSCLPIFTVGTGLYLRALLDGLGRICPALRRNSANPSALLPPRGPAATCTKCWSTWIRTPRNKFRRPMSRN